VQSLPISYLDDIARQLSFLSAFLGGFAATFFVTLLVGGFKQRSASVSISLSAIAASSFVVAVISFVMITVVLNPEVPDNVEIHSSLMHARLVGFLSFGFGVYALLGSVGFSGWVHSRTLGRLTTVVAVVSLFFVSWAFIGFG
jgi:ABC-type Fe3+-siderophore transport system permease subunit